MIFGAQNNKGLILEGSSFKIVELGTDYTQDDILIHDRKDKNLAMLLSEITYIPELPVPIGIIYQEKKATYEDMMSDQIVDAIKSKGKEDYSDISGLLKMLMFLGVLSIPIIHYIKCGH